MTVIGRPAQYARKLRRTNILKAGVTGAGCVAALAMLPQLASSFGIIGAGCAGAVAAGAAYASWQARIAAAKNTAGIRAEMVAAKALRSASFDMVAYGAMLGKGDCDVIVAGPQLAIVEVKHGRGRVRVEQGTLRDDRKAFGRDPVRQATAQAATLRKMTGTHVDAVVCVTGMTNAPFSTGNTVVCSAGDLAQVLQTLPHRMSKLGAATLVGQLRAQPT